MSLNTEMVSSGIVALLVNIACQGTAFSSQWILRDLEVSSISVKWFKYGCHKSGNDQGKKPSRSGKSQGILVESWKIDSCKQVGENWIGGPQILVVDGSDFCLVKCWPFLSLLKTLSLVNRAITMGETRSSKSVYSCVVSQYQIVLHNTLSSRSVLRTRRGCLIPISFP